eukprot:876834_1
MAAPFIDPCSLNGEQQNGQCHCDPGWKGPACTFLKLAPTNKSTPGYQNKSMSTWGGGQVYYAQNQYHIFVGAKAIPSSQDDLYLCNSKVVHLVSNNAPNGPYYYKNDILSNMNLNPQTFFWNNTYFIFDEGYNQVPPIQPTDKCEQHPGSNNAVYNISNITTQVAYSTNPNAPLDEWMKTQITIIDPWPGTSNRYQWDCNIQNPTPYIFDNGTTILMYRAIKCAYNQQNPSLDENIGIAVADNPLGPYKKMNNDEPVFGFNVHNEDPFLWRNKRGFHLLMHAFLPNIGNWLSAGAYAYSLDGLSWTLTGDNPWISTTQWTDGTTTTWIRRQKPALIFDDNMNPVYLINGVDVNEGQGYRRG